eukprot:TRINITY_DN19789_c0_g1_i1.p2 TRINITY_DN19789_c0_g1~~TRINITY_DN19789_c0_g1_i1.p2  ORF type:complete len:434 (+),score=180.11 TRINITY_DN19789_c0_g1_i1:40-1341(+)
MTRTASTEPAGAPMQSGHKHAQREGGYFFRYLSDKGIRNIPHYKYKGTDKSFLYQKVVSPGLNKAVEQGWVPKCVHPNVITLTGFSLMAGAHLVTWLHCRGFHEDEVPKWVWIFNAFAMVFYWILDALDGKQARAIGESSPLGLLMDHGCDALNTTIGILNLGAMLSLGSGLKLFIMWSTAAMVFFGATWEEYYVGSLDLPMLNGPNEGVVIGVALHLWTAVVGTRWWSESLNNPFNDYEVVRGDIVFVALSVSAVVTCLTNSWNVYKAVTDIKLQKEGKDHGKDPYTTAQLASGSNKIALSRGVPFSAMLIISGLWALLSPSDILSRHPRTFMWILGLLLCKLVMGLMVAHLSDDSYHPFGKTFAALLALGTHMFFVYTKIGLTAESEDLILFEVGAVVLVSYVHMVISLFWEISCLLGISIFFVKPKTKTA